MDAVTHSLKQGVDYIGIGCGAMILNDKGETLLIKRASKSRNESGCWAHPGGAVEFGESVEDAIRREIREEIGVEVGELRFMGFLNHILHDDGQHWLALHYFAKITSGEPKNLEPGCVDEIRWFALDNLPPVLAMPTRDRIQIYLKLEQDTQRICRQINL